ncbi:MAG: low molecular weight protein-tyrosine-phosphatase [Nitriliruptoraceae bacterium]
MTHDAADAAPQVLMVCLGNICRSPTAEAALKEAADEAGVPVNVTSAGTGSWHIGNPPDRRMQAAAAAVGLNLVGTAEQVEAEALRGADVVFAMDASNLRDLQELAGRHGIDTPMRLFREFDPQAHGRLDVPDPYYGGPTGFEQVVDICRRTAREIVQRLPELVAASTRHGDDH